ncbi:MAG: hypothetical protein H8E98_05615 [Bacteroidetes bacterium]|nr:hypothetical protein [Bacteroidota bacterium]
MDRLELKKTAFRDNIISQNKDFLQDKIFIEFGVMDGDSIIDFYNLYQKYQIQDGGFIGLDSFYGLPEEKIDLYSPWKTSKFTCNGKISKQLLDNNDIDVIAGEFKDTLNDSLVKKLKDKKIGIVHIDCDIYSSTLSVLDFMVKNGLFCEGQILIYDDWGCYLMNRDTISDEYMLGEARAHKEIVDKYKLDFNLVCKEVIDPSFYVIAVFKFNSNKLETKC